MSRTFRAFARRSVTVGLVIGAAATLAALASGATNEKVTSIAAIDKHGDNPYFIRQELGVKRLAARLHFKATIQDVGFDANKMLSTLDTVIAAGAQGVMTTVPDQKLGPVVIDKARKAGIPIVATNDPIKDSKGKYIPFIGFNARSFGGQVGVVAAKLYDKVKAGWGSDSTKIASIEQNSLSVCKDRTDGAAAAFFKAEPKFGRDNIVHIAYDNSAANAITVMGTTITAHPEVKHWIIWSCNDDGVVGAVRALENANFATSASIGVGLGGNQTCQEFAKKKVTSYAATIYVDAADVGQTAAQLLYDNISTGKKIPLNTFLPGAFVNRSNYHKVMAEC
jgi:L-arabinose transport system substrate-binding protein